MDTRTALIQAMFPYFYEVKQKGPRSKCYYSSYAIKHDLEWGMFAYDNDKFYFGNEETIRALVALGVPHYVGQPNYGFKVKAKFPMMYVRNPIRSRPKYESKKKWEAYLLARKELDALVAELTKDDTSDASSFTKLAKVVGYSDEGFQEVPASLAEAVKKAKQVVEDSLSKQ